MVGTRKPLVPECRDKKSRALAREARITAHHAFRRVFKGHTNPMTPSVHDYATVARGGLYVELSRGDGLKWGSEIWGVTVLSAKEPGDSELQHALSRPFPTQALALAYILALQRWQPGDPPEKFLPRGVDTGPMGL